MKRRMLFFTQRFQQAKAAVATHSCKGGLNGALNDEVKGIVPGKLKIGKLKIGRFTIGILVALAGGLLSCDASLSGQSFTDNNKSETVTILGPFSGQSQAELEQVLAPFEEETGIDVVYEGVDNFNSILNMRIGSQYLPDLAFIPQPGIIQNLVADDLLVPLTDVIDEYKLRTSYSDNWLDIGAVDGVPYAIWYRASVKSLVWYRPSAFEAKGYDIPQSWTELIALSDRIVKEGGTPWCIGLESGDATGWPATDWIEDILLRSAGPEAYRQWVTHEMPFNSPSVLKAFSEFDRILRKPKYVYGGAAKSVEIAYDQSPLGLFSQPPNCYMHRQGSFITAAFPPDETARVDYDVFPLPGIDEKFGQPILVAGDAIIMFNSTPASQQLINYLASPEANRLAAGFDGLLSPHKQVPPQLYNNVVDQSVAQILADAETIHFDGSDAMPGYIGSGIFWEEMVEFAKGKSAQDIAKEIDESWPNY